MISINKINWDKLKEIEIDLRWYAHGKDCIGDLYDCPREHGHKMSIDKSFAWTLADRLYRITKTECELDMEDLLKETLMMYATFKRHKDEYPELFQMAKSIYRACHQKE